MEFTTEYMYARRKQLMKEEDENDLISMNSDDNSDDNDEVGGMVQDKLLSPGKNRLSNRMQSYRSSGSIQEETIIKNKVGKLSRS